MIPSGKRSLDTTASVMASCRHRYPPFRMGCLISRIPVAAVPADERRNPFAPDFVQLAGFLADCAELPRLQEQMAILKTYITLPASFPVSIVGLKSEA